MRLLAAAELPGPRVGDAHRPFGVLAKGLQPLEERHVTGRREAIVEEQLRTGEDRRAIDVVLALHEGQVADPHRPHAAIAFERGLDALGQLVVAGQAEQRLDSRTVSARDDVVHEAQITLHGLRCAEPVQRLDGRSSCRGASSNDSPSCDRCSAAPGSKS